MTGSIAHNFYCCGLWLFDYPRRSPEASARGFDPPPVRPLYPTDASECYG